MRWRKQRGGNLLRKRCGFGVAIVCVLRHQIGLGQAGKPGVNDVAMGEEGRQPVALEFFPAGQLQPQRIDGLAVTMDLVVQMRSG